MARKSRQVEVRMISEYLKKNYSGFSYILNVPLGSVSEEIMRQEGYKRALGLSRPFRPIADAVVILPRHLLLVEAKVWNVVDGLAKLPLYKALVPVTPELIEYKSRSVILQLVVGWTNPNLETMAIAAGVAVKIFCPLWLEEVVGSMHKYWTREYRDIREKKLAMREFFGID